MSKRVWSKVGMRLYTFDDMQYYYEYITKEWIK